MQANHENHCTKIEYFSKQRKWTALRIQKDLKVNITCPAGHKMHWMCLHSSIDESQPVCYLSLIQSCQWQGWVVKCNKAHLTKWTAMLSNSTPEHQLNSIWNKFLGWFHLGKGKGLCSILSRVKWVQLQTWRIHHYPQFLQSSGIEQMLYKFSLKKEQPRKQKLKPRIPYVGIDGACSHPGSHRTSKEQNINDEELWALSLYPRGFSS